MHWQNNHNNHMHKFGKTWQASPNFSQNEHYEQTTDEANKKCNIKLKSIMHTNTPHTLVCLPKENMYEAKPNSKRSVIVRHWGERGPCLIRLS